MLLADKIQQIILDEVRKKEFSKRPELTTYCRDLAYRNGFAVKLDRAKCGNKLVIFQCSNGPSTLKKKPVTTTTTTTTTTNEEPISSVSSLEMQAISSIEYHVPSFNPVLNQWNACILDSENEHVKRANAMKLGEIEDALRLNQQPLCDHSKPNCVERLLMCELNNVAIEHCDQCGGYLYWDHNSAIFRCGGKYSQAEQRPLACSFATRLPKTTSWIPLPPTPRLEPNEQCPFQLVWRLSTVDKIWRFDLKASRPCHVNCVGSSHVGCDILEKELAGVHTDKGKISVKTLDSVMLDKNLGGAAVSTVRRALNKLAAQDLTLRSESESMLPALCKRIVKDNPGSVCLMQLRSKATNKCYKIVITSADDDWKSTTTDFNAEEWKCVLEDAMACETNDTDVVQQRNQIHQLGMELGARKKAWLDQRNEEFSRVYEANVTRGVSSSDAEALARAAIAKLDAAVEAEMVEPFRMVNAMCEDLCTRLSLKKAMDGQVDLGGEFSNGAIIESLCMVLGPVLAIKKHVGKEAYFMDGCHMKFVKGGQLILFEVQTVTNRIFPVAFNYCFSESRANMALVAECLVLAGDSLNKSDHLLHSDRSKASVSLTTNVLRQVHHRYCEEHIKRNVQAHVRHELLPRCVTLLRSCFRELEKRKFESNIATLRAEFAQEAEYLDSIDVSCWAGYSFAERKLRTYGTVNNNSAESEARRLLSSTRVQTTPVEIVIALCSQLSKAISAQQQEVFGWDPNSILIPHARLHLEKVAEEAGKYKVEVVDSNFQVYRVFYGPQMGTVMVFRIVKIKEKSCTCLEWYDFDLPCVHAWAVGLHLKLGPVMIKEWCGSKYFTSSFRMAFQRSVLCPSINELEDSGVKISHPDGADFKDEKRKPGGQPAMQKRIRSTGESMKKGSD